MILTKRHTHHFSGPYLLLCVSYSQMTTIRLGFEICHSNMPKHLVCVCQIFISIYRSFDNKEEFKPPRSRWKGGSIFYGR